jgi:hypothetical protein
MDYEKLLKKYMIFIAGEAGSDFLECAERYDFSVDEKTELERISRGIDGVSYRPYNSCC